MYNRCRKLYLFLKAYTGFIAQSFPVARGAVTNLILVCMNEMRISMSFSFCNIITTQVKKKTESNCMNSSHLTVKGEAKYL